MNKLMMVLRVAVSSLTIHKMRTILTMLGIVIGVAAVISLVAVGQGAQAQVLSQFQSLGSNLVTVSPMQSFGFRTSGLQTSSTALTMADVKAIEALADSVSLVAPVYSSSNATATYGGNTTSTSISGVTEAYATVRNQTVSLGRFITTADNDKTAMVVVLGTDSGRRSVRQRLGEPRRRDDPHQPPELQGDRRPDFQGLQRPQQPG